MCPFFSVNDPERMPLCRTRSGVTTTFVYDADGNRVKKTTSGGATTLYWYLTPGIVGESDLAGTMKSEYVFFNGERVARRDLVAPLGVFYYFSDHLKTASVITDSAGNIRADSDYYPWGGELQFVNADSNHYKFTGKERDTETNLDYFGARYYSNGLGRFITPDWAAKPAAVPYAEFADPQSLNLYTYVRNLPTSKVDGDGHADVLPGFAPIIAAPQLVDFLVETGKAFINFLTSGPPDGMRTLGSLSCTCPTPANHSANDSKNKNNSYRDNKAEQMKANSEKGRASEERVLKENGLEKNTQKVSSGEGRSIPDHMNDKVMGEIKDSQRVANTRQLRIQKEAAAESGRQHELTVGTNTKVTDNAEKGTTVIKRDDLGPK